MKAFDEFVRDSSRSAQNEENFGVQGRESRVEQVGLTTLWDPG